MLTNTVKLRGVIKGIRQNNGGNSGTIILIVKTLAGAPVDDSVYDSLAERAKDDTGRDELLSIIREYEKLHEQDRKICFVNYPVVNFNSDTENVGILEKMKPGDRLSITAHIGIYKKAGNGRVEDLTFIYADKVERDVSKFEEAYGTEGRIYDADENFVYASGRITSITEQSNSLEFKVATKGSENRPLRFVLYRPSDAMKRKFSVGDGVNLLASAQSIEIKKTDRDGKRSGRDFHRFVISTIEHEG